MAVGLASESFWDQTPRTHAAIMRGRQAMLAAENERDVALAWHIENFSRTGKRFRSLGAYLDEMRPKRAQTAEEVIALFQGFAARGLATITMREKV